MEQLIQKTFRETSHALNDIFQKRKRALLFQKIVLALTGLFFILMLFNAATHYFPFLKLDGFIQFQPSKSDPYSSIYSIIGLAVIFYLTSHFFIHAFQQFKIKESKVITRMVKSLFPKVEFTQTTTAPHNEIKKSKLFAWVKANTPIYNYGQIRSSTNEQLINIADIGIIEQNTSKQLLAGLMSIPILNMLVVLYEYVLKNLLTNKSADNVYYTFRGMFCWLNFKKSLKGHTVVLTNNQSSKLNRFFSLNYPEEQRVYLEDPRFTNQFIVYSTDQVESRYVLSTTLMERIIELKEKFNQPIILSFQDQQMFLAVKNENGLFSFSSGKLEAKEMVEELASDINTALQIGAELKLR